MLATLGRIVGGGIGIRIVEAPDEETLQATLEQDRVWNAFALADLDEPYRQHSRYICALKGGSIEAVALIFQPPGLHALHTFGSPEGLATVFGKTVDLPSHVQVIARREDVPAVRRRYALDHPTEMIRMHLTAASTVPPPAVDATIARLGAADIPALEKLYAHWPDGALRTDTLELGPTFGAREDGQLIAAAGTHALSARLGIAAVGGVFTLEQHRGRGLAKAVTGAVVSALLAANIRDVVLNVRADNSPAVAAYRRLGFKEYLRFPEGPANLFAHDA